MLDSNSLNLLAFVVEIFVSLPFLQYESSSILEVRKKPWSSNIFVGITFLRLKFLFLTSFNISNIHSYENIISSNLLEHLDLLIKSEQFWVARRSWPTYSKTVFTSTHFFFFSVSKNGWLCTVLYHMLRVWGRWWILEKKRC